MPLVLAALVVLAIITTVVLVLGLRCSSNLARASAGAEVLGQRASDLEAKVGELEGERDSADEHRRAALEAAASAQAELDRSEAERRAAQDRAAAADARSADLEASLSVANARTGPGGDLGTLELLLARLERQWAEALSVGADERGLGEGSSGDQVAQALARELERVKEEVGVETTYRASESVQIANPTAFLLASGEVIAVLASGCEQVHAELNDQLVLTGRGWQGSQDDLDAALRRATAAGLAIEPVEQADGELRLGLRSDA